MAGAFQYKPKFVDIRVRPPTEEEAAAEDVWALKPGERACDHPGCRVAATARAPKSRDMLNEHYWFCQPHAAEYNRSWNFFQGMSEGEIRARQENEMFTGGRPTWDFKASNRSREAAGAFAGKFAKGQGYRDPFDMFGRNAGQPNPSSSGRSLGKLERNALADLDLDDAADGPSIRARYTELVKRCHPDANGGDRSSENKLQRVIKAYQSLRKAGMV
ncbi:DnaJ domain-containing protein [Phenylobacterium sp.]|uniref:DnaJ domain-containing protein n=1 Tax=Phenylobacterium sp. TaxID=1871053 RepID=UPI002736C79E|nr:J domain-containing protein [Phenylobacterium sp.]MDP3174339.1 J domain-containing protein [Phenylobacterium sp.]MDP3659180.1 J domain-containing protein [Phenylobacterium sp.]